MSTNTGGARVRFIVSPGHKSIWGSAGPGGARRRVRKGKAKAKKGAGTGGARMAASKKSIVRKKPAAKKKTAGTGGARRR